MRNLHTIDNRLGILEKYDKLLVVLYLTGSLVEINSYNGVSEYASSNHDRCSFCLKMYGKFSAFVFELRPTADEHDLVCDLEKPKTEMHRLISPAV